MEIRLDLERKLLTDGEIEPTFSMLIRLLILMVLLIYGLFLLSANTGSIGYTCFYRDENTCFIILFCICFILSEL